MKVLILQKFAGVTAEFNTNSQRTRTEIVCERIANSRVNLSAGVPQSEAENVSTSATTGDRSDRQENWLHIVSAEI